jgi:rod shape-determining protein MreC
VATDRSRRRTWTLSVAVLATLIILYLTTGVASGLRSGANLVVTPFSWAVNEIARNQKLRYQLGEAEERANEGWAYARQLQQLTTELDVPFVGSLPTVSAQVTTLSPTNFAATVDISKGRDNGVLVGMPVVANGGLIGSVIGTTPHGATVRLITDTASLVGVTFASGTTDIVVAGRGLNNGLSASSVPLGTSVVQGTHLTTDGLNGGLFPAGLPVATVKTVTLTPGAATYNLTLQPAANLRHIAYVDVVLWEPSS